MKRLVGTIGFVLLCALGSSMEARECGGNGRGKQKGEANGCFNQCVPPAPDCTLFECAQCACSYVCITPGAPAAVNVVVEIPIASFVTDDFADDELDLPFTPNTVDLKARPKLETTGVQRALPER